jgi:mechanosensitive ion channel-like protein
MERVDVMLEPLRAFLSQVGVFLPRLLLGVLILVAGFVVAKAASFAVRKALRAINFHIVTQRSGMDGFLQQGGTSADITDLFGQLVYWVVILAALIVAFNSMGLTYVTELLGRVMLFVPRLFVALLILAFGAYFARFVGNAVVTYCRGIGVRDAATLGKLARYAIVAFAVMIALDHLEIGGAIVRETFLIVLAGLMLAVALAFGLGGKDWAAAHLEHWWPSPKRDELR